MLLLFSGFVFRHGGALTDETGLIIMDMNLRNVGLCGPRYCDCLVLGRYMYQHEGALTDETRLSHHAFDLRTVQDTRYGALKSIPKSLIFTKQLLTPSKIQNLLSLG